MVKKYINRVPVIKKNHGFTLIELLVVIAVITLLLALLLPALNKTRMISKRLICKGKLKQIAVAWNLYLDDHDGAFYQGVNANLLYGGWKGTSFPNRQRPLNKYLGIPALPESQTDAKVFECPGDDGSKGTQYYPQIGTSYQTNILLIGQDQIGTLPSDQLQEEINKRLKNLNLNQINNPGRLLLVGDYTWGSQWLPGYPKGPDWHGRAWHYNLAFLDGHVEFLHIRKGLFITDDYTVLPFEAVYELARSVQAEEP